jgi:sucrose phosphorylase
MGKKPKPTDKKYHKTLHSPEPDYTRPLFSLSPESRTRILGRLEFLYGEEAAAETMRELERIMKVYYAFKPPEMVENERYFKPSERFTEKDMILQNSSAHSLGSPPPKTRKSPCLS